MSPGRFAKWRINESQRETDTPPIAGTVFDGSVAGVDSDVTNDATTIYANWSGFSDPETGIAEYEWAIGTTPGGEDEMPFTSVGLSTSASEVGPFARGLTYYVTVRATNGAGLKSTATSDGIYINDVPVPADQYLGPVSSGFMIPVYLVATDPEANYPLTWTIDAATANGAVITEIGEVTSELFEIQLTPAGLGADSFQFYVTDSLGLVSSYTATVSFEVF